MHVLEYVSFCRGFLLFTLSIRLVLWSNYNVAEPSSVSPIIAIKIGNCFKVTTGLGEILERFPSSLATELGRTPVYFVMTVCTDPKCNQYPQNTSLNVSSEEATPG